MRHLILLIFLSACTTNYAEISSKNAIEKINNISEMVSKIEKEIPDNCKNESIVSNIDFLKEQTVYVKKDIDNILTSCNLEKKELKNKIFLRDIFNLIFLFVIFLFVKNKIF